jgi:hypothetical protein
VDVEEARSRYDELNRRADAVSTDLSSLPAVA